MAYVNRRQELMKQRREATERAKKRERKKTKREKRGTWWTKSFSVQQAK